MEIRVRGIKVYRSRGKLFAYHRKTGKRIKALIGSAAFLAEIERLNGQEPAQPRPGTLGALIAAYRRSPEFLELAERTRRDYVRLSQTPRRRSARLNYRSLPDRGTRRSIPGEF